MHNIYKNLSEVKGPGTSPSMLEPREVLHKRNTNDDCVTGEVANGVVADSGGEQLNMRMFQSTKAYLVLQEVTKNDATLIPQKLLDYLVDMTSTYTCTPLGCTMRESTDYLIRELFHRLQTGQVWVALKVFYVFYQLLWRGSRSLVESVRALDVQLPGVDATLDRIKLTPQENISGAPLPCTLPCAMGNNESPCNASTPRHSCTIKDTMRSAITKCGISMGRATVSTIKCGLNKPSKCSQGMQKDVCKTESCWLHCANKEYLSSCVSSEFMFNCLGYIGALCEYCYQHHYVDLANKSLLPSFTKNATPLELKALCEDTLELLQSTATLDVDVPIGFDLVKSMLLKRLSDARVLYFICCHALVMYLHTSISKAIQTLRECYAELAASQPCNAAEKGEIRKDASVLSLWGTTSSGSTGSSLNNSKGSCPFEHIYACINASTSVKTWYSILHQFDRTIRMLRAVCEAVKEDNGEALALMNYTTRIPKEVLDRMSEMVRMSREKQKYRISEDGDLLSMSDVSERGPSVVQDSSEIQISAGEPRGTTNVTPGGIPQPEVGARTASLPVGIDVKSWEERFSYARVTWAMQMKCLRELIKEDNDTLPLINDIEKKLAIFFNEVHTMWVRHFKATSMDGSGTTQLASSQRPGLSDSGTLKHSSTNSFLFAHEDPQSLKRGVETAHHNPHVALQTFLEEPGLVAAGVGPRLSSGEEALPPPFSPAPPPRDVDKGHPLLASSSRAGGAPEGELPMIDPCDDATLGLAGSRGSLQLSHVYHIHSRGSEPTLSPLRTLAENDEAAGEDVTPLTEDMMHTNASIQSLLEKDDVVVVCNESFSSTEHGNMAERFHTIRGRAPIGEGSCSRVYRAWDELFGRYLAVKEVALDAKRLPAVVREVLKEYMVLTSLRHPNIVHVVAFMIDSHSCKIFMEWLPSGSLQDVLRDNRNGALRESVVSRYIRDTLIGLSFLHSRGVLHRDIKPANMLLSTEGAVKLSDFGTSALLSEDEHTLESGVIMGTAPYMAPEVVRGVYSAASDVWSLGCTAMELVTGHVPWEDLETGTRLNPVQLIYKIGKLSDEDELILPHSHLRAMRPDHGGDADGSSRHRPVPPISEDFLNFLDRTFVLNRHARATTAELLEHPFITKHHVEWKHRRMMMEAAVDYSSADLKAKKEGGPP